MSGEEKVTEPFAVWKSVDQQMDLDQLDRSVCWDDSHTVEYYGTPASEPYFPGDVARSGYENKNVHILCRVCSRVAPYLELALIDCDWLAPNFLEHLFFRGRVDTLKRVEICNERKSTLMRCSRLLFRFLRNDIREGAYFRGSTVDPESA